MKHCDWYWGGHGCDLPLGHDGLHVCSECSEFELCQEYPPDNQRRGHVRYLLEDGTYSEWLDTLGFQMDNNGYPLL